MIQNEREGFNALDMYKYFTENSNTLTAIAAAFIIPYAVDGIRKKRFTYPLWLARLHYAGTICTTLTMFFALTIISMYDPHLAFGDENLYLHFVCPIAILISFWFVESDRELTAQDSLICMIPFVIYVAVYICNVVFIGEENGGWRDLYKVVTFVSPAFSLPGMMLVAFGTATLVRLVYNKLTAIRRANLYAALSDDADPVEIRIEGYGLGRYVGVHEEEDSISLQVDVLRPLAEKYNISLDDMMRVYTRGVIDGLKDRDELISRNVNAVNELVGRPDHEAEEHPEEEAVSAENAQK
jgi:hypothetical protein